MRWSGLPQLNSTIQCSQRPPDSGDVHGVFFRPGSAAPFQTGNDMINPRKSRSSIRLASEAVPVAILLVSLAGCATYTNPPAGVALAVPADPQFDALWQASIEVLRRYRFRIDRQDRRAGVITTRAMLARHWFEFWRRDAVTTRDVLEGSLQTVYRRATIRIERGKDNPKQYVPRVTVVAARPTRGGMEIVGAGEAYGQFIDALDDDAYRRSRREQRELRRQSLRQAFEAEQATASDRAEPRETLARKIADEILRRAQRIETAKLPG